MEDLPLLIGVAGGRIRNTSTTASVSSGRQGRSGTTAMDAGLKPADFDAMRSADRIEPGDYRKVSEEAMSATPITQTV